jgi:hypothetical protein
MQAQWILKMINRPSMGAGLAFAALMAVSALSAATGPGQSLGTLVASEAASLEGKARDLRSMVSTKFDPAQLAESVQDFRAQIASLRHAVESGETTGFSSEQLQKYELIRQQLALLDQITSNKEGLLAESAGENRRVLRYKAANLMERARLLGKTAQSANFPAPAASAGE